MPASSWIQDRTCAEIKRLCYAGLDEETLLHQALDVARRVVPFDLHCAHSNDPASGLITRAVHSDPGYQQISRLALEHVYFEDDVAPFTWMAKRRLPAVSLSDVTGGNPALALRYQAIMDPLGVEHELRAVFALDGELWGSVTGMRMAGSSDFDERDVAFIGRIAPHLAAGLMMASLRSEAHAAPDEPFAPAVLTLNQARRVIQHTATAETWLGDLGDLGPDWREGIGLPAAVSSVTGALEHALDKEIDRDGGEVPRLIVRGRSGRWLTISAARTEPNGETMVIIQPAGPRDVAWLRISAYGLTKRERQVVDLVARGASTRQIAETLFISEYTVQEHLSNVFEKVGTRSRRELVKRLYLESIL